MQKRSISIGQLKDDLYRQILDLSRLHCDRFLLVIRNEITLGPNAITLLARLKPFEIRNERRAQWPGTRLTQGEAYVNTYRLDGESLKLLKDTATNMFAWQQPRLPEDLCFLRPDDSPWLCTVAHENQAWFQVDEEELHDIFHEIPNLRDQIID